MSPNEESIKQALATVKYPGYSRDIVSFGLVKAIQAGNDAISVRIELTSANPDAAHQIKSECETALKRLPGVQHAFVEVKLPTGPARGAGAGAGAGGGNTFSQQTRVPGLSRIIAVASGKGGVGKSTCAVNLACALRHEGASVGLLDCDIYGPSVPLMMGVRGRPQVSPEEKLLPPENYGIKLMSMGFLLEDDQPVIWRGPMIMKTVQQFVLQVEWGELDFLLVDLPPGTGDAQLSLCQTVPLDGGVVITTPQEASLGVVRKGIAMFEKVNVPILGLIENMSYFTAPGGERVEIFGHGGGRDEAQRRDIPFLGEIPIFTEIREGGDTGKPVMITSPESPASHAFLQAAQNLKRSVSVLAGTG